MPSLEPELWVDRAAAAVAFYEAAFGARRTMLVGAGDDIVCRLAVGDASFWVVAADAALARLSPHAAGGTTGRTLLVVEDPDAVHRQAVAAGATDTAPVTDEHGWRLGRIVDPFGHEWEIGREDAADPSPVRSGLTPGPFASSLGFRILSADEDGAVVEADPGPEHCNGGGIVHGGYLSSLLDTTTGWAIAARLPEGARPPHVHLSVQFVRAALPGSPLVCRGRAISAGRRIGSAEAEITQGETVVARAVSSHAIIAPG